MIDISNIKDMVDKMDDINTSIDNKNNDNENKKNNNGYSMISDTKQKLVFHYDKDLEQPTTERLEYLRNQVKELAKLPQPEQRSEQWYEMRKNKITASDWAAALGKNPYSYKNKLIRGKCGEKQSFYGGHMQHGVKYEPVANMIYEFRNNVEVIEFGLIPHPKIDYLGASPDGITPDGVMVEIKCPPKRTITGEPPLYYWIQVQGQLEVCELDRCDFLECKIIEYEDLEVCPVTQELEAVCDNNDDDNVENNEMECIGAKEQYFLDNCDGNYFYNEYGMEKGVVLVFVDNDNNITYKYSKLGILKSEYDEWFERTKKETIDENNSLRLIKETFWKLTEVSNVPIYRDEKWFENNLPELKKFWDDVLHYRKVGIEEIKTKPRVKRTSPKIKREIFIDTSIDDYNNDCKYANAIANHHNTLKFKEKSFFRRNEPSKVVDKKIVDKKIVDKKVVDKKVVEDNNVNFKNKFMFRAL